MDGRQFDDFLRCISTGVSRRGVLWALVGIAAPTVLGLALAGESSDAKRRRKRKRKKKKNAGCVPACQGRTCGADGCGGVCGSCRVGETCVNGNCAPCIPQCGGKVCGPDGCGGTCNPGCPQERVCVGGVCVCPDGQDECGGQCRVSCAPPAVRNLVTCTCCRPVGEACNIGVVCCTDPPNCSGDPLTCAGGGAGAPCQFDAQCQPALTCQSNQTCG